MSLTDEGYEMHEFSLARLPRGSIGSSLTSLSDDAVLEAEGYTCPSDRCGRAFSEPLKLTNLSRRPLEETYYACPFCLSRVQVHEVLMDPDSSDEKSQIEHEFSASSSKERKSGKTEGKSALSSECPHQFGYLNSRSKGAEIPDKCLTCAKILQCMSST